MMPRLIAPLAAMLIAFCGVGAARADAGFDRWVQAFWTPAHEAGVSRATYEAAFRGLSPDPDILQKAQNQAEFVKPIGEYLDSAVSEKRVSHGRDMLARYGDLLGRIERAYGVDRYTLVAVWGMESFYGEVLDDPTIVRGTVRSLATLAYADRRRSRYARQQLIAALKIIQRGDVSAAAMTGSWAGAMGQTQFIPTTYNAYAVDFDGDGRRNIWTSPADALASTANYLRKSGWVSGKTWGYEVVLPPGFDARRAKGSRSLAAWQKLGLRRPGGATFPRPDETGVLAAPAGASGPAFIILRNHFVIRRYNNALAYALAVGHLADRLRGGGDFAQAWPGADQMLSPDEMAEVQLHLARVGLYDGAIDGKLGEGSRAAIRAFQSRRGMPADGAASRRLLEALRNS
jgi:membrane-bound lytic murein transglycosylase B